ncbi:MAG: rRNA cytosine-C5-methylase, partial [Acidiphilium sp. 21-62-4]
MADPTRDAAYALISAVLERGQGLDAALDALPPLEPRDRAAAHMLAATVLRHEGSIDAALEPYLKKAPPPPVRHILRLGAAQLLYMGTAAHAAVTTAVTLTDAKKLKPFTGLVNAVLRKLALAGTAALAELDQPRLDTPSWLWASWGANARAIAVAHQSEAPLDLSLRPGAAAPPGGMMLPTGSVRMPIGTRVTTLPGFGAGD